MAHMINGICNKLGSVTLWCPRSRASEIMNLESFHHDALVQ